VDVVPLRAIKLEPGSKEGFPNLSGIHGHEAFSSRLRGAFQRRVFLGDFARYEPAVKSRGENLPLTDQIEATFLLPVAGGRATIPNRGQAVPKSGGVVLASRLAENLLPQTPKEGC
jgi:hypothetical protein